MSAREHAALAQKHARLSSLYARLATAEASAESIEASSSERVGELLEKATRLRAELDRELAAEPPIVRAREER